MRKWLNKNKFNYKEIIETYESFFNLGCTISPNYENNIKKLMSGEMSINAVIKDLKNHDIGTKLDQKMKEKDNLTMKVHETLVQEPQFLENTADIMNQFINTDLTNNKQKDILAESINAMVDSSIDANIKSAASWKRFSDKQRAIKEGSVIDWAVNNASVYERIEEDKKIECAKTEEKSTKLEEQCTKIEEEINNIEDVKNITTKEVESEKNKQNKVRPFEDYLLGTDDEKKALCIKIADYLKPDDVIGKHIALMILALNANGQLRPISKYTDFYTSIRNQFKPHIGSNSGISEYLNPNGRKHIPAKDVESFKVFFNSN